MTTDIAVGQMRQLEFVADEEGDWAFHCHKSHHTMNAMGHDVPTMIGVDHRERASGRSPKLVPDYMVMGERGMADMAEMEMPLPDNTAPMMTGDGPVRLGRDGRHVQRASRCARDQKRGDYSDPGWFKHPRRHDGLRMDRRAARSRRASRPKAGSRCPPQASPARDVEVQVRKPAGHSGH